MSSKSTGMWGARFEKGLRPEAVELSYSLRYDQRLFPYDIKVNKAHVAGLGRAGYLQKNEVDNLTAALEQVAQDASNDPKFFDADDEDVHSFVERQVVGICGY